MHILLSNDDGYQAPGLKALFESTKFHGDINLTHLSINKALTVLKEMKVIRRAEEEIALMVQKGDVVCPCHWFIPL